MSPTTSTQRKQPQQRHQKEQQQSQKHSNSNVDESQMMSFSSSYSSGIISTIMNIVKYTLSVIIFLNMIAPLVIVAWPNLMSHMIFQNFIYFPFKNLSNPGDFGLDHAYSFKLQHQDVQLGAWHILPDSIELEPSLTQEHHFEINFPTQQQKLNQETNNSKPPIVVLYLHGNINDRSQGHRIDLYKMLRGLGVHVVAVDYRGYGDSTGTPTEIDVVSDALFTYEYLRKVVPQGASVYIWGHSLGTGISSSLSRMLSERGRPVDGLILEAPFYNIAEEIEYHPFSWVFLYNPLFFRSINYALESVQLMFRNDIHLSKVKSKMMIIHAEDDLIIPVYQSEHLYELVKKEGISDNVTFHKIPYHHGCGHRNIYSAPNITDLLKSFLV